MATPVTLSPLPQDILTAQQPVSKATPAAYESDRLFYRIVACTLGGIAVLALIASWTLAAFKSGTSIPEVIVALGSSALGALAGLLTPRAHR